MRKCGVCKKEIPDRIWLEEENKWLDCRRRKFCINCSPYGKNNRKNLAVSDKERRRQRQKWNYKFQKRARHRRKQQLVDLLGGKCKKCSYNKCLAALEFHHRDPNKKEFALSKTGLLCSWEKLIKEAEKCDLLCRNCHTEEHERLRQDQI